MVSMTNNNPSRMTVLCDGTQNTYETFVALGYTEANDTYTIISDCDILQLASFHSMLTAHLQDRLEKLEPEQLAQLEEILNSTQVSIIEHGGIN